MKSSRFDHALLRLLLIAAPFSCGGKTYHERVSGPQCGALNIVPIATLYGAPDGGVVDGGSQTDGGLPPVLSDGGTTLAAYSDAWCARVCHTTYFCEATVTTAGQPAVACHSGCTSYAGGCGRRPDGLPAFLPHSGDALGAYLERATYLEAASVVAFGRLAAELQAYGAPEELVAAARAAAVEEEGHAASMCRLAGRAGQGGGDAAALAGLAFGRTASATPRSLIDLARENAVEGCVREMLGALIACFQAENAQDPEIRAALKTIAHEETGHARLAFAVAEWADGVLDAEARAEVRGAQIAAIDELAAEVAAPPPAALRQVAGWPSAELMQAWVAEAQQCLWG
jgi:hypothetical protein